MTMAEPALVLLAFLLGAIPFGVVVAELRGGVDLRQVGSGNIGATNVTRALGRSAGVVTTVCDASKGLLPVVAAQLMSFSVLATSTVAAAAFLGHCYSPYLGFRGGKGIAVGLGVSLGMAPIPALLSLAVWSLFLGLWHTVSLASLAAAALLPVSAAILPSTRPFLPVILFILLVVVFKHRGNIRRMRSGTEHQFVEPGRADAGTLTLASAPESLQADPKASHEARGQRAAATSKAAESDEGDSP
jgi:glycerol-3-phosphate acyltransferase PlsY